MLRLILSSAYYCYFLLRKLYNIVYVKVFQINVKSGFLMKLFMFLNLDFGQLL